MGKYDNYEQLLQKTYQDTLMKREQTEDEAQWEERVESESRARLATLQSPLQGQNQDFGPLQRQNKDFHSRVEAGWPPLLVSWTAEGSPVQQQPSHKETGKEARERRAREREMKLDGCTAQAEYTYDIHQAMKQGMPKSPLDEPKGSEKKKRQYVASLAASLNADLKMDCIEERNMAQNMHAIQERKAQYALFQSLLDSNSPYLEGIDPAVLEGIAQKKEIFLQTAALADAFREAQGVGEDGKYTDSEAMKKGKEEYEKKRREVDSALGEHCYPDYARRTKDILQNNPYQKEADTLEYLAASQPLEYYKEGRMHDYRLSQICVERYYADVSKSLTLRAELEARLEALSALAGGPPPAAGEELAWLEREVYRQTAKLNAHTKEAKEQDVQKQVLDFILYGEEIAAGSEAAALFDNEVLDPYINELLQRENADTLEARLDTLTNMQESESFVGDTEADQLLKNRIAQRGVLAATQIEARDETMKNGIVPGVTKEEWDQSGGASYHHLMSIEEAKQAAEASGGFLYYVEKEGSNMAEVRTTIPEKADIGGQKDFPLRRTYNQMMKLLLGVLFQTDEEGRTTVREQDELKFHQMANNLSDNLIDWSDLKARKAFLDMLYGPAAEMYGEEADAVLTNIGTFMDNLVDNDRGYVFSELGGNFTALVRLPMALNGMKDLGDPPEGGEKAEEEKRLRETARQDAEETLAEIGGILTMKDDEIDVPLPNQCSANHSLMKALRPSIGMKHTSGVYHEMQHLFTERPLKGIKYLLECFPDLRQDFKSGKMHREYLAYLAQGFYALAVYLLGTEVKEDTAYKEALEKWSENLKSVAGTSEETLKNLQGKALENALETILNQLQPPSAIDELLARPELSDEALRKRSGDEVEDALKLDASKLDASKLDVVSNLISMLAQTDYLKYDYHVLPIMGMMPDGTVITSETFAAETKQYMVSPLTRSHKSVGHYNMDPTLVKEEKNRKPDGEFASIPGAVVYYNCDRGIRAQEDKPAIEFKNRVGTVIDNLSKKVEEARRAQAETMKHSTVPGVTSEEWNRSGGASYHQYMTVEEAKQAVEASKGFLYYVEKEQWGIKMAEVRATIPEKADVGGQKDFPLRRTYNQMMKLLMGVLFKVDKDTGKADVREQDVVTFHQRADDLSGSLLAYTDPEFGNDFLALLREPAAEMYGKEAKTVIGNIKAFMDYLGRKEVGFAFSELATNLAAITRLPMALNGMEDLGPLPKGKEKAEMEKRLREMAKKDAEESLNEIAGILQMEDDEIDVPLPNQCSANNTMIKALHGMLDIEKKGEKYKGGAYEEVGDLFNERPLLGMKYLLECFPDIRQELGGKESCSKEFLMSFVKGFAALADYLAETADQMSHGNALGVWSRNLKLTLDFLVVQQEETEMKRGVIRAILDLLQPPVAIGELLARPELSDETLKKRSINPALKKKDDTIFAGNEAAQLKDVLKDYFKYDYHAMAVMGTLPDGTVVTSETFAAETKQYLAPPLTRSHKSIGHYQTDPNLVRGDVNPSLEFIRIPGAVAFYNNDRGVRTEEDKPSIEFKNRTDAAMTEVGRKAKS